MILQQIKKYKTVLPLILVLFISFCSMLYFGTQKQGYHVDEIYSYGLSNSEYLPFMHFGEHDYDVKDFMKEYGTGESFADIFRNAWKDLQILIACDFDFYNSEIYHAYKRAQENSADIYTTTWVSGQDYKDYLTVSESNTFNYASVYYNQRGDVHPPMFYILLHTICSFFQGNFSKWFGLGLNMVILSIALVILYRTCERHFGGHKTAIIVTAIYAFSCGFMSTAMFIRMYALLTFMTLLCTYVHLELLKHEFKWTKKRIAALFFSILGGYYTQYYFVLYAIGIAVTACIIMLYRKQIKNALIYIMTLIAAAGTGILIWPFSIKHVFGGYRGRESLDILKTGSFYSYKAEYMIGHISSNMFGGKLWLAVTIFFVCTVILLFLKKGKLPFGKIMLLMLPIIFYTFVVGQISPFLTDRYVMCTYPFWGIMITAAVYYALKEIKNKLSISSSQLPLIVSSIIAIIFIGFNNWIVHTPGYLNPDGQETYIVPENTDCVFVIPDGSYNESSEEITVLAQCDRVGVVYESNLDILADDYQYESGDYLLVEIINSLDENIVLEKVKKSLNVEHLKEIDRQYASCAVRILLRE